MQQTLPKDSYECNETIKLRNIHANTDDSVVGFHVEIHITYQCPLYDTHKDSPLAPKKLLIHKSCLPPYAQSFKVNLPSDGREKLVETSLHRNRYIYH